MNSLKRSSSKLSAMKGLRSMPLLPKNMMYVKEHNPKFFKARVCYLLVYFVILVLFAVYAIGGFIAFIRTFNQTVLTSTVGRESKIHFPVIMLCPVIDTQKVNIDEASIDYCGSIENMEFPKCGAYIDQPDSWKRVSKGDKEELSRCRNNIWNMRFPTFLRDQPNPNKTVECLMFNLDQPLNDEIIKDIYDDRHTCNWDTPESDFRQKELRKENKDGSTKGKVDQAYATGTGSRDRYQISIKSRGVRSFSIRLRRKIEDFDIRDADNILSVVPEGSSVALFLRRVSFTCETCNNDEIYFNSTMNFFTLQNEKTSDGMSLTSLTFWFESMTTTFVEEVKTTTTLDYLGNFAGMLGTLLGFAVIAYVDRLIAILFIRDGAVASVWDDPQ